PRLHGSVEMILSSIRWRLQAWHSLLLVLVLGGFGVVAYNVARDNQQRRIDQELDQRLGALLRPPPPPAQPPERPPSEPPEPRPFHHPDDSEFLTRLRSAIVTSDTFASNQTNTWYCILWQRDGSVLARSADAPLDVPDPEPASNSRPMPTDERGAQNGSSANKPAPGPPQPLRVRTREGMREMFRCLPNGECLLVGRSLAPDLAAMRRLGLWLVCAGGGVLVLGLVGGWWVAGRAIRPIQDISATALKIAAGDLSQRINAADTESELGRLAAVLNSTFARLEAAFAQQARFTADASHELRTPVAVVLNQTQSTLARSRSVEEYREALQACQRAAQRMRKLTESLLQLARLDAGQEPFRTQPFELSAVVEETLALLQPLAAEAQVELHSAVVQGECTGDRERIAQVLLNLVANAIQFNHPGGCVRVSTGTDSAGAWFSVEDTGCGIPDLELPRIFERFYRADKARSGGRGSSGLGLAITKAIVDTHNGTIKVSSTVGKGSTFTVTLPFICPMAEPPCPPTGHLES
ncbi:MAG: HAMP domain-containing sensor histidine kinase, partial [Limisphaerales bacterium]